MRKLAAIAAALLAASASATPPLPPPPPPAPPPKLLIVIAVDMLSSDLFDEYRPQFTGGLARMARGASFRNGYQAHAATETCPGHAGMLTGAFPARTGVIANDWHDLGAAREDKQIYCAEDESVAGSSSDRYTVSPAHLRVPTLGDLLKARSPRSMNVAVAGKDRAAVMMSGRRVDQRWYFPKDRFVTDLTVVRVPEAVTATNRVVAAAIAQPRPALDPPPACTGKATPIPVGSGRVVGNGRFDRAAGDSGAFRTSPEWDGAVLALAAGLIGEMKLGADAAPDLLSIGLSATDYVGHKYGSGGQEMCLQLLSLDRDLGDFFRVLDTRGVDYAVALTADHGVLDIPERQRLQGVADATRVDPALAASEVGKGIAARLGIKGPLLYGGFHGDIYIDRGLSTAQRAQVRRQAVAAYRAHSHVEAVFTAEELRAAPLPTTTPDRWTLVERARASFDPQRSGDLVVLLRRNVTPIVQLTGTIASHGSPWDYDRRVPILFWRPGMPDSPRDQPVKVADIMPTLAAMLSLPVDRGTVDGDCLLGVAGVACPPR